MKKMFTVTQLPVLYTPLNGSYLTVYLFTSREAAEEWAKKVLRDSLSGNRVLFGETTDIGTLRPTPLVLEAVETP